MPLMNVILALMVVGVPLCTLPWRDGWVSLAVGYHHSGAYRVDVDDHRGTLASTFSVGGFYVSALIGPFRSWRTYRSLF